MKKIFFSILTILLSNYMSYSQAIDKNHIDFNNYLILTEFDQGVLGIDFWRQVDLSLSSGFLTHCDLPTNEYLKISVTDIGYKNVFGEYVQNEDNVEKHTSRFDEFIDIHSGIDLYGDYTSKQYISKLKSGYIYTTLLMWGERIVILHRDRGIIGIYRENGDLINNLNAKFDQYGRILQAEFYTPVNITYDSNNNISKVVSTNSTYELFWKGKTLVGYTYHYENSNFKIHEERTFKILESNEKGLWTHAYILREDGSIVAEFKREIEPYFN